MSTPQLAFLVAAHRATRTLPDLVKTLLAQDTGRRIEICIAADEPTDYSKILPRDPRLHFAKPVSTTTGPAAARSRALSLVTAPRATILDADDKVTPDFLKRIFDGLRLHEVIALHSLYEEAESTRFVRSFCPRTGTRLGIVAFSRFLGSIRVVVPTDWVPLIEESGAEDMLVTLTALARSEGALPVVSAGYRFQLHPNAYCAVNHKQLAAGYLRILNDSEKLAARLQMGRLGPTMLRYFFAERLAVALLYQEAAEHISYHDFVVSRGLCPPRYAPDTPPQLQA